MIDLSSDKKLPLIIASSNTGKIKEFRELLIGLPINVISQPDGLKVEENGKTFEENARLKAFAVSKITGHWALSDDSGLSVDALNGSPGIHSARYANSDEERINRLINEMRTCRNRNAKFVAALCVASDDQVLVETQGVCKGKITRFPRGKNGFGYDPIFEMAETGLTFAEMDSSQKKLLGHRGKAFELLRPLLIKILNKYYSIK